jgi:hypothetical protein
MFLDGASEDNKNLRKDMAHTFSYMTDLDIVTLLECGYTHSKLRCNECGAYSGRPAPPFVEEETPFPNTHIQPWKEQKFSHMPRRVPKPRTTVLMRASNNLLVLGTCLPSRCLVRDTGT